MATTADFRNGLVLMYNNDLHVITEFQHVKPGKAPPLCAPKCAISRLAECWIIRSTPG